MIENIRRYTGLIFIVIVLLLLGFIFMDTSGFFRQSGAGGTVVTISGRPYSLSEFNKLGKAPFELIQRIPDYRLFGFLNSLRGDATEADNQEIQFFAGRMMIRQAREDFGVHPSDAEVAEAIQELRFFQNPAPAGSPPGTPGSFNQEGYNSFVQRNLGSYGMVERDFQDLIRDVIATEKLKTIIGGGLEGSRHLAEAMVVMRQQQVEASVASIDVQPFRESIDPSEEELKEWWETRKDAYKTEQKVKLSYVLATPEYPEEIQEKDEPTDPAADAEKTAEQREAEETARQERAEARSEIDKQLALTMDDFSTEIDSTEGKDFETAAEKAGLEIKATDWVTRTTLPAELRLQTRSSEAGRQLPDIIFGLTLGPDPLSPFTLPIPVGEAQFLVVRLDDLDEVREKTFEEAQEQVREDYIAENADEKLREEIESKTESINSAIAEGKSFEEAAKAVELEARKLGPWGMTDNLDNEFNARQIFQLAAEVNPGEFAEPFISDDRAVLIYVENRQIIRDDNRGSQIDNFAANFQVQAETAAFSAWLNQRLDRANVQIAGR